MGLLPKQVVGSGQIGVMIFFVLSGFLMSFLYLNEKFSLANFTISRVFRVLPLYFLVIFSSYLIFTYIHVDFAYKIDTQRLISHFYLQGSYSVFWTIPVEIKYYIFFASFALTMLLLKHLDYNFNVSILLLICFLFFIVFDFNPNRKIDLLQYINFFIFGSILGLLHKFILSNEIFIKSPIQVISANVINILSFIFVFMLFPSVFKYFFNVQHGFYKDGLLMIIPISFFIISSLYANNIVTYILKSNIFLFLGKISFSLYLVHIPILKITKDFFLMSYSPYCVFLVGLIACICFSWFVHIVFEQPFIRLGKFIIKHRKV